MSMCNLTLLPLERVKYLVLTINIEIVKIHLKRLGTKILFRIMRTDNVSYLVI